MVPNAHVRTGACKPLARESGVVGLLEALAERLAPTDLQSLLVEVYRRRAASQTPADLLKRVHAPIGLDIGAVTPQEIAVSILAELIAVKHGKTHPASMTWTPPALKTT